VSVGGETGGPGAALVRRAFEAFADRDLDRLLEIMDPEIEFFAPTAVIANDGRCYRGHDGIERYLRDVDQTWSRLEIVPEKFREVGNHVVVLGRVLAKARDGLEIDSPAAWVWQISSGALTWGCTYANPGESFMGLTLEDADSAPQPIVRSHPAHESAPAQAA
jgi:ketosteroid isomerase-like protein